MSHLTHQLADSSKLSQVHRHVTTHSRNGLAIFENSIPVTAKWEHVGPEPEKPLASLFLAYTTTGFPVEINPPKGDADKLPVDIGRYKEKLMAPPREFIDNESASVLRYVDLAPATEPFMHRTQSLDYGIVIDGEVELILDSGERRLLKRGDSCVQRATMHAWRNTSKTEWARMVFILISSTPPEIEGNRLGQAMASL